MDLGAPQYAILSSHAFYAPVHIINVYQIMDKLSLYHELYRFVGELKSKLIISLFQTLKLSIKFHCFSCVYIQYHTVSKHAGSINFDAKWIEKKVATLS